MDCSIADENIFNCTQDIKGLVPKSENLRNEIKRITQIIQVSKRSEKIKKLDTETFRYDIYIQNQSGFCTGLPICWALALETYINDTKGVSCRWVHKYDKLNRKFASSEILLYFNSTNWVNIVINYTQGYLMVKGAYFKKWIEEEFPKVRDVFTPVLPTDDRTCPSYGISLAKVYTCKNRPPSKIYTRMNRLPPEMFTRREPYTRTNRLLLPKIYTLGTTCHHRIYTHERTAYSYRRYTHS